MVKFPAGKLAKFPTFLNGLPFIENEYGGIPPVAITATTPFEVQILAALAVATADT